VAIFSLSPWNQTSQNTSSPDAIRIDEIRSN
jgi:hypothetical protein